MIATSQYPSRPKFFALSFQRWLISSGAARRIGPNGMTLLAAVVLMEDAKRYEAAPTFWLSQLVSATGMSKTTVCRVRKLLVSAGLLKYESGSNSRRKAPGVYWVIPGGRGKPRAADAQPTREALRASDRKGCAHQIDPHPYPNSSSSPPPTTTKTHSPDLHRDEVVAEMESEAKLRKINASKTLARSAYSRGFTIGQFRAILDEFSKRPNVGAGYLVSVRFAAYGPEVPPGEGWPTDESRDAVVAAEGVRRDALDAAAEFKQHGLRIYPVDATGGVRWAVGKIEDGYETAIPIAREFRSIKSAREFSECLMSLADWRLPAEELSGMGLREPIATLRSEFGVTK